MKMSKISITFMLMAFITFPFHAMESALTNQSEPIPDLIKTSWSNGFISLAFNPVNPEIALGGCNKLSLFNINTPDKPDTLNFDADFEGIVVSLAYNPQGTLLGGTLFKKQQNKKYSYIGVIWDLAKKIMVQKVDLKTLAGSPLFNLDGTKLVMHGMNNIIIWDLTTNTLIQTNLNSESNDLATNLARTFDGNTFVHNNSNDTVLWHLDNPSEVKSLPVDPSYVTIFGANETQLASYSPDGHMIQLMYGQKITSTQVEGFITKFAYCPRINKYFFTTIKSTWLQNYFSINILDPDTLGIKELFRMNPRDYERPYFSPDGNKLFVSAGTHEGALQFHYIDLINLMRVFNEKN